MFTDSWIYRGFMRFDLWTKQHGGQGIDRRKMHSFVLGHLRGDYLGLNIVLRSFVMQCWISMKDHTTLCLHAEFVATHAKPPLSPILRWNKEHDVDFWQPPDISRSHLYRGTFPWTPTTAIYWAYTVLSSLNLVQIPRAMPQQLYCQFSLRFFINVSLSYCGKVVLTAFKHTDHD